MILMEMEEFRWDGERWALVWAEEIINCANIVGC